LSTYWSFYPQELKKAQEFLQSLNKSLIFQPKIKFLGSQWWGIFSKHDESVIRASEIEETKLIVPIIDGCHWTYSVIDFRYDKL
jgi:hypothetical protein